ncbi:hypothetical protein AVEN_25474-1 [Araneus ventricosus]|uniref:Uncharacterized protein n=1 Tax=Araneus ventricosus TaxID=182803 RepID=A0A4Y2CTL6_ARAVE|nr:hypothetical protein AVEN_25474-1 [Araneus ventricosus]
MELFLQLSVFIVVILTFRFEATRGLFWDDLVSFNHGRIAMKAPEPPPPSPSFRAILAGGILVHCVRFNMHDGFSVESVFEPGTLYSRSLTTKPPLPLCGSERRN